MNTNGKHTNTFFIDSANITSYQKGVLVIGGILINNNYINEVNYKIKQLKQKYELKSTFELKWSKTSIKFISFYDDIFDYIFMHKYISVHILVSKKSENMNRNDYLNWYISMHSVLETSCPFKFQKIIWTKKNKQWDPILNYMNLTKEHKFCQSKDSQILQVSDFIVGAIASFYNNVIISKGKLKAIKCLQKYMKIHETTTTLFSKNIHTLDNFNKYNLFKCGFTHDNEY